MLKARCNTSTSPNFGRTTLVDPAEGLCEGAGRLPDFGKTVSFWGHPDFTVPLQEPITLSKLSP